MKSYYSHTSNQPECRTVPYTELSPAQLMLQELRRSSLMLAQDWAALPATTRHRLSAIHDIPSLLRLLAEYGLLTSYQVQRISRGEIQGLVLGNYRVLDKLGSGSMGVVYRAEHRLMRRHVAVKVVTVHGVTDHQSEARFMAELRAVSQLEHPNIVSVFDAGEVVDDSLRPALYYYVMEYIAGQSLDECVAANGPLPLERACDIVCQIASALEQAHQRDLIHRDIKPSNIMVTAEGQAKLLDFGLVRDLRQRVTRPGLPLGTLAYMAPEQARDSSSVDARADVFGLGSVLFWCLTGRPPFESQYSLGSDLVSRMTLSPPDIRVLRPDLPADLGVAVARMMAFDRADRYPSALAVQQAFIPFLKARPQPAPALADMGVDITVPPPMAEPRMHRILIVDDEEDVRRYCSIILTSESTACVEAPDGAAALDQLQREPFDLVLIDGEMPRRTGPEVVRELRQQPPCPNLKILMMSGRVPTDEMARLMLAGTDDFLSKPFSGLQLQARVKVALRLKDAQDRSAQLVGHLLQFNRELERTINARDIDLIQARNAIVLALAKLAEYRDNETGVHLMRLERYCHCLAEEAARGSTYGQQINGSFIDMLVCCAPLHDIGKVGVPDLILRKPGRLDAEEEQIMRTHTLIGAETLLAVARQHGFALPMLHMAAEVARHHHERFDGSGYPDRLAGTDIPLPARLVAIADVYDALRSRRVYKPALNHTQTVEIMLAGFGAQFDPALLQSFQRCAPQFEHIYADSQETGNGK